MNIYIPFYGKEGTIREIKELGENYFEIKSYNKHGIVSVSKVNIDKKFLLNKYLNNLEEFLNMNRENYDSDKLVINGKVIKKRCIIMILCSIITCFVIPVLGYISTSGILFVISMIISFLSIPTLSFSAMELLYKRVEHEVKRNVDLYENLNKEKNRVKNELLLMDESNNKTKFRSIEPKKVEEKEKIKKLIKEKE